MNSAQALPIGYLLHGTYRIERVLGQGGFGITYLATDLTLDVQVAIKEFFPKAYCQREESTCHVSVATDASRDYIARFKAKFLKEARIIAKLNHPNIVRIHAAFEAVGTAYYVMELVEGESLAEMVRRDGPLSPERALRYIRKVGSALSYIHSRKMNHLDVKPANIMVRRLGDEPVLIDFGLSKAYDEAGSQTSTSPVGMSHGFAPSEQYRPGGVSNFSPSTDLYALAATLYFLLSGVVPPSAICLIDEPLTFPQAIPQQLLAPIGKAMSVARDDRQRSVEAFLREIEVAIATDGGSTVSSVVDESTTEIPVDDESTTVMPVIDESTTLPPAIGGSATTPSVNVDSSTSPKATSEGKRERSGGWRRIALGLLGGAAMIGGIAWGVDALTAEQEPEMHVVQNHLGTLYNVKGVEFQMIAIEGGSFTMGSDAGDAYEWERGTHRETVGSFMLGQTEVTQELWRAVMGSNPSHFTGRNSLPVENVSWNACQEFITRLNELTHEQFRLPTEAEWEFAARGGVNRNAGVYSGGIDDSTDELTMVGWSGLNSNGKTQPVTLRAPNSLQLHDMTGNVWEMTSDRYKRSSGEYAIRGGGWDNMDPHVLRVTNRSSISASEASPRVGLRLAL